MLSCAGQQDWITNVTVCMVKYLLQKWETFLKESLLSIILLFFPLDVWQVEAITQLR